FLTPWHSGRGPDNPRRRQRPMIAQRVNVCPNKADRSRASSAADLPFCLPWVILVSASSVHMKFRFLLCTMIFLVEVGRLVVFQLARDGAEHVQAHDYQGLRTVVAYE